MKIYLASSWKNEEWVRLWKEQLVLLGHEVDAFCDDSDGRFVFHYSEIGDPAELDAISFLADERTKKAFLEDKKMIDWADTVLMILPAGKSSHLEAGYAKGTGKKLIIWQKEFPRGEFDVMYGFADLVTDSAAAVVEFLSDSPWPRVSEEFSTACHGPDCEIMTTGAPVCTCGWDWAKDRPQAAKEG